MYMYLQYRDLEANCQKIFETISSSELYINFLFLKKMLKTELRTFFLDSLVTFGCNLI